MQLEANSMKGETQLTLSVLVISYEILVKSESGSILMKFITITIRRILNKMTLLLSSGQFCAINESASIYLKFSSISNYETMLNKMTILLLFPN